MDFINRPELECRKPEYIRSSVRVCSIHFKPSDFKKFSVNLKQLHHYAVPSVRQFSNCPPFDPDKDFSVFNPTPSTSANSWDIPPGRTTLSPYSPHVSLTAPVRQYASRHLPSTSVSREYVVSCKSMQSWSVPQNRNLFPWSSLLSRVCSTHYWGLTVRQCFTAARSTACG